MKILRNLVLITTGLFALLCVVGFPVWILGVPGVEKEYARGWMVGLQVIMSYPVAWCILLGAGYFRSRFVPTGTTTKTEVLIGLIMVFITLAATFRLYQAFDVMSRG